MRVEALQFAQFFGTTNSDVRPATLTLPFQVVVMASHWGDEYYHFVTEGLPRIMPVLDLLLEHRDIQVTVRAAGLADDCTVVREMS